MDADTDTLTVEMGTVTDALTVDMDPVTTTLTDEELKWAEAHEANNVKMAKGVFRHETTPRGFQTVEFTDFYGNKCSIQESSVVPNIWLGLNDIKLQTFQPHRGWVDYPIPDDVQVWTRMHLSVEQARGLIPYLQNFVDGYALYETSDTPPSLYPGHSNSNNGNK